MKFDADNLNRFYRYSYSLTGDPHSAYDLLHTALEKYLGSPPAEPAFRERFLLTVIRNTFIDQYRHAARFPAEPFEDADPCSVDIDLVTLEELAVQRDQVEKILAWLSPFERELLYLWAVEGYTAAELSTMLEVPRGTILSRIHRLRQKVKQNMRSEAG